MFLVLLLLPFGQVARADDAVTFTVGHIKYSNESSYIQPDVDAATEVYVSGTYFAKGERPDSFDAVIPSSVVNPDDGKTYQVVAIGYQAFYGERALTSISLPVSIREIGEDAFNFTNLSSVALPAGLKKIDDSAFEYSKLAAVDLPEGLESLGEDAFASCDSLSRVVVPGSVKQVGDAAFYGCSQLSDVTLGEGVGAIGFNAFAKTAIERISLPASLKYVAGYAFKNCSNLTDVTLGEGVGAIGSEAFAKTAIERISLPASLKYVAGSAFDYTSLVGGGGDVRAAEGVIYVDRFLLGYEGKMPKDTIITVKDGTTFIAPGAFKNYTNLGGIVLPASVGFVGEDAFESCTGLIDINLSATYSTVTAELKRCNIEGAELALKYNGERTKDKQHTWTGIASNKRQYFYFQIYNKDYKEVSLALEGEVKDSYMWTDQEDRYIDTRKVRDICDTLSTSPTSITFKLGYDKGDAIEKVGFYDIRVNVGGKYVSPKDGYYTVDGNLITVRNLDPNTKVIVSYDMSVRNSPYDGYRVDGSGSAWTRKLSFTTLPAKATSNTMAVIAAKTNITDEEAVTGFEWRNYDAPDLVPSTQAECGVIDGELIGALKNLSAKSYYKYRPYYTSASGNTYYGDWLAFGTGDAYVYFDPTVKTYGVRDIEAHSALVRGYVVSGSGKIRRQGFEYWVVKQGAAQRLQVLADEDRLVVEATGTRMSATLTGLEAGTTYACRAFATTDEGTVYGDEQTFTTPEPTGIESLTAGVAKGLEVKVSGSLSRGTTALTVEGAGETVSWAAYSLSGVRLAAGTFPADAMPHVLSIPAREEIAIVRVSSSRGTRVLKLR